MMKAILRGRSEGRRCKCWTFALFILIIAATSVLEVRGDASEKLARDIRALESVRAAQTPAMTKLATCFRVRLAKAKGDVSSYPEKMRETRSQVSGELLECELEVRKFRTSWSDSSSVAEAWLFHRACAGRSCTFVCRCPHSSLLPNARTCLRCGGLPVSLGKRPTRHVATRRIRRLLRDRFSAFQAGV